MSCCPNAAHPGTGGLPFHVDFNTGGGSQTICNTSMCLLPNGPVIPTRPIFPSALPSEFRPSGTNIDTNYLNVKRIACICNLRCNCLSVDDGGNQTGSTNVNFLNLPSADTANPGDVRLLVVDAVGKVYTKMEPIVVDKVSNSSKEYTSNNRCVKVANGGAGGYDTDDSHINMHDSDLVQRALERITKMYPGTAKGGV